MEKVTINGVEIYLSEPDEVPMSWVGQDELVTQVLGRGNQDEKQMN